MHVTDMLDETGLRPVRRGTPIGDFDRDAFVVYGQVDVPLRLVVSDVGATTGVEIWVGNAFVTAFKPGTRHPDSAVKAAHEVLAAALKPLIEAGVDAHPHAVSFNPEDDNDY